MYGSSCYYNEPSIVLRPEAEAACAALGYHLLTITSAEENQFVTDYLTSLYARKHITC